MGSKDARFLRKETKKVIKGILFDKDGTLIKFQEIWVPITYSIIDDLLELRNEVNKEEIKSKLAESIGLYGEEIDEKGFLASGTSLDIATQFNRVLSEDTPGVFPLVAKILHTKIKDKKESILPTCDLQKALSIFKEKEIVMGITTSDDYESTKVCIQQIGIDEYIDFIGTGDRYNKKPDPEVFNVFCEQFGLKPDEVLVVGDTICDMKLSINSKSAGGIGVLSGVGSKETLGELAKYIIPSIEKMINENGKFIWE
jgi:phosphoglycolate phosphatase